MYYFIYSLGYLRFFDLVDQSYTGQAKWFAEHALDTTTESLVSRHKVASYRMPSEVTKNCKLVSALAKNSNDLVAATSFFWQNGNSEQRIDYVLKVWGPIIEAILSINGVVRPKSTTEKGELYDADKTRAFKIGLRFIFAIEKIEYDVGAGESSREPAAPKLFHDLGKLLREGKEVLDGILGCTLDGVMAERASD
ncbi:hypothetical protein BDC45DRAFT_534743 [Circinella umbellata]|nr:hypothetical protein BDC45DRAFT_534743 [Circinella umbellata]